MSTPDDAPKPEISAENDPSTISDAAEAPIPADKAGLKAAADAILSAGKSEKANDDTVESAETVADDELPAEPSGWGKGTISAIRSALGGGKNADAVADEITKLVDENAEVKDRMLRLAADMENLRKRTEREKADTAKYAVSKFAEDMLRVGDNLGRALESVPEDMEDKDAALKSLRDGIAMTSQELVNGLEKHGVVKDEPKGEVFDPNRHQAIAQVEDPEVPAGVICEVFQIGYMISDRVLRPAMVVVSKGPAKEAPAEVDAGSAAPEAANDDAPVESDETPAPEAS